MNPKVMLKWPTLQETWDSFKPVALNRVTYCCHLVIQTLNAFALFFLVATYN